MAAESRQILVADPHEDTRALYGQCLRLEGFEVIEAVDGRDALVLALAHEPALVIAEIRLPVVDGAALCETLRSDAKVAATPILLVTAESRPAELARARRAGATELLTKPVKIETLVEYAVRLTSAAPVAREAAPHRQKSRAHRRFTTVTPPMAPPALTCPSCARPLTYERSHIGGVSAARQEQWDDFTCATCGGFQDRHRTRKLRRVG